MLKFYIATFVTFVLFGFTRVFSQVNYSFTAAAGTYTAISGGTSATLTESDPGNFTSTDEGYQNNISIGFAFNYNGTVYNSIHINTNGFASFTPFVAITDTDEEAYYVDDLSGGPYVNSDIRPILAPFWDDLDFSAATNIKFITSGSSPSRVFTVEWGNALWDYSATSPVISFQIKLYEGTNVVEFVYRRQTGARAQESTDGASIGITSAGYDEGSYLSLSNSGSSPTASSTINTDNITVKPATGQIYRFTPTSAFPVTLANFRGEKFANKNQLSWITLTEQNNKGFELQRSADGRSFSSIAFIPTAAVGGNSTSSLQYSFGDVRPLKANNYYRLKQVDKDLKISYSAIVLLKGSKASSLQLTSVYPNPTSSSVKLIISAPASERINILITDLAGKVVMKQATSIFAGDNNLSLNVETLPSGSYMIKVVCNAGCESATSKFVKQ
jgi:hypothetical protein